MLERKDPDQGKESMSSFKLFNKMREDNDHTVDQEAVLRARLLDMLIADWDRHFDQWRWATRDTGQGKIIYSYSPRQGPGIFLFRWTYCKIYFTGHVLPFLKGLQYDIPRINELNAVAKDFDRMFLNNIDEEAWSSVATDFTKKLTDQKIAMAIQKMPPEIYAISGKKITDKLISRNKVLKEQVIEVLPVPFKRS